MPTGIDHDDRPKLLDGARGDGVGGASRRYRRGRRAARRRLHCVEANCSAASPGSPRPGWACSWRGPPPRGGPAGAGRPLPCPPSLCPPAPPRCCRHDSGKGLEASRRSRRRRALLLQTDACRAAAALHVEAALQPTSGQILAQPTIHGELVLLPTALGFCHGRSIVLRVQTGGWRPDRSCSVPSAARKGMSTASTECARGRPRRGRPSTVRRARRRSAGGWGAWWRNARRRRGRCPRVARRAHAALQDAERREHQLDRPRVPIEARKAPTRR